MAGWIHLNQLPVDRVPTIKQLNATLEFAPEKYSKVGIPQFLGRDELNNEVFFVDFGNDTNLGLQTACLFLKEHSNLLEWKFFDIRIQPNTYIRFGRMLYMLKLANHGQKVMSRGIQSCYFQIAGQVIRAKELCKSFG